jgi:hypothetical protein
MESKDQRTSSKPTILQSNLISYYSTFIKAAASTSFVSTTACFTTGADSG